MTEREHWTVGGEAKGSRLDHFLTGRLGHFSRGQIKTLLDEGRVLVNRRRVLIGGWELEAGDIVEVRVPPGGVQEVKDSGRALSSLRSEERQSNPTPRNPRAAKRYLKILFEDRDIIVVDKPSGVIAEPAAHGLHDDLVSMIKGYLRRKHKDSRGSFVQLVHRLDTETSGVMVAAKSKAGVKLEEIFRRHEIERRYDAIVAGRVEKGEGRIDLPLEKGEFGEGKKVQVSEGGKKAVTEYRVVERYPNATWLEVEPETGRTHQIRVHLSAIGHPIIGDKRYGGKIPYKRQALHAKLIRFRHPVNGKKMEIKSPMPPELSSLIDHFRGG